MDISPRHRHSVHHYHDPGDLHELTFSCHNHLPLLTNDHWRRLLAESISRALANHAFALVAFVFMPEHVHLLVYPSGPDVRMDPFLYAIKRPFSYRIKMILQESRSPLLNTLTVVETSGKAVFRFWQKGPGYDRNLKTTSAAVSSIDYIHANPVRRGLSERIEQWKWSSARWYLSDRQCVDPDLPAIQGLPTEFLDS